MLALIVQRCLAKPSAECPMKRRQVRIAQQKCCIGQRSAGIAQVLRSEIAPDFIDQFAELPPFVGQFALQGARRHGHASGYHANVRMAVAQAGRDKTARSAGQCGSVPVPCQGLLGVASQDLKQPLVSGVQRRIQECRWEAQSVKRLAEIYRAAELAQKFPFGCLFGRRMFKVHAGGYPVGESGLAAAMNHRQSQCGFCVVPVQHDLSVIDRIAHGDHIAILPEVDGSTVLMQDVVAAQLVQLGTQVGAGPHGVTQDACDMYGLRSPHVQAYAIVPCSSGCIVQYTHHLSKTQAVVRLVQKRGVNALLVQKVCQLHASQMNHGSQPIQGGDTNSGVGTRGKHGGGNPSKCLSAVRRNDRKNHAQRGAIVGSPCSICPTGKPVSRRYTDPLVTPAHPL